MNKVNFDKLFIAEAQNAGEKNKLLLHCCCAPCSSACLERLKEYFRITVLFYNPNIEPEEYAKRKAELLRYIKETGVAEALDCDYDQSEFYGGITGLEREPEGGKRCEKCFYIRLKRTAEIAERGGFDYFTTTLTLSPLKNAELINAIGESLQGRAKWLHCDFKKRGGYQRSLKLSQIHNLYRQDYCGCVFSRRERLEKKADK